jgi:hypothetical protein
MPKTRETAALLWAIAARPGCRSPAIPHRTKPAQEPRMTPASQPAASQHRNISVLALAQALFMSVQGMGIAASPLAAHALLAPDDQWLATAPIFLVHLAVMGTTIPASLLMGVIGRRAGFSLGAVFGSAFGVIGCLAMYRHSFPMLCLASVFQGMQAAFFWYFRLAAADASEPSYRSRAISLVMAGGVLAGFIGPQAAKWAVDWLAPVTFAGIYLAAAGFSLAVLVLVQLLRIPRLSLEERSAGGRPIAVIARQPAYRVAVASSVFGYAVMTLTMSATPLAMLACGFGFGAHHRHVSAVVLHRQPDRALRRVAGDRRRRPHRVRLRDRQPGWRRLRQLPDRQCVGRNGVELLLYRRLDLAHHNLHAGRTCQGPGQP